MKLTPLAQLNDQSIKLISQQVLLEWATPGRALVTFTGSTQTPTPGQLLEISLSVDDLVPRRLFWGYVESVSSKAPDVYTVLAREFSAALNQRLSISLRHCNVQQVLEVVSEKTGFEFVLEQADWVSQLIPRFQHIGGGYMALDMIGTLWRAHQYCWHQQPDGRLYVGRWGSSLMGQKTISLPIELLKNPTHEGASIPVLPRLRPGVKIQTQGISRWVTKVEWQGEVMRLGWSQNPWHTHLKAIR